MLNKILESNIDIKESTNIIDILDSSLDYQEYEAKKAELIEEWKLLEDKTGYNSKIEKYFKENLPNITKEELQRAKRYDIVCNEVENRIHSEQQSTIVDLKINPIILWTSLIELLENIENRENLKNIYRLRKLSTGKKRNSGISSEEADNLKNCLRQGRELLLAGKLGALLIKPLNYFYSLSAYSYAITILNNPVRYALENLPSSHGLQFLRSEMSVGFGSDYPHGTFTELVYSFPSLLNKDKNFSFIQNNLESLKYFSHHSFKISIGMLLSLIPEIRDYYYLSTGSYSRTHPLEIVQVQNPRRIEFEFKIGDGNILPSDDEVTKSFEGFQVEKKFGQIVVKVAGDSLSDIKATIWSDENGQFWFIENPFFPLILPDICIHFLIITCFSNIMRYDPPNWGDVLLNNINSNLSLIIRKYLSSLEYKIPFMVLRNSSAFWPYIK